MFFRYITLLLILIHINASAAPKNLIRDFERHLLKETVGVPNAIHTIDIDKDGDYDLVPELYGTPVCWWENKKPFEVEEYVIDTSLTSPRMIPADMDNDGYMDLVYYFLSFILLKNTQAGSFETIIIDSVNASFGHLFIIDMEGDGDSDMVAISDSLFWFENMPDHSFQRHTIFEKGSDILQTWVVDMDGDSDADLLFKMRTAVNDMTDVIWIDNDNMQFTNEFVACTSITELKDLAPRDMDNDQDMDIILACIRQLPEDEIVVYEHKDDHSFDKRNIDVEWFCESIHPVDLNHDSLMDFVICSSPTPGSIMLTLTYYHNTGNLSFAASTVAEDVQPLSMSFADIDLDSILDIITTENSSEYDEKLIYYKCRITNNVPMGWGRNPIWAPGDAIVPFAKSFDFDCDGDSDIVIPAEDSTFSIYLFENTEITPILTDNYKLPAVNFTVSNVKLSQNMIHFSYTLDNCNSVSLDLISLNGKILRTLVNKKQLSGRYNLSWDLKSGNGIRVSNGIYFARLVISFC